MLWGNDGLPFAVVEAKKSMGSPLAGQQQAKLYADCLAEMTGQRPLIYYSNGYDHWLWDDAQAPPRSVQGFHTKDELARMIQRRTTKVSLADLPIADEIVERYYQKRAIRAIGEHFEADKQRRALVVMATGASKTRTVVALADLLMRANLVKRVLFLADRQELVKQAVNAFKTHLPDSAPVNLLTEGDVDGRVYVSTYQTMMARSTRSAATAPAVSGWGTSIWWSSTRRTGRCIASIGASSTTSIRCWWGSPSRLRFLLRCLIPADMTARAASTKSIAGLTDARRLNRPGFLGGS
ncbi:putative restriction endonuclease domain protein [Candidatus Microthrix parvicella RN1]|uniref:Putative restriction endonuclease domain protein n=1 Tax=Candidatus Neomicrothrix parvicella RN1 TaxID=1229780 RepID=R4Z2M8_9ACTN|nr:DEAD/DEAH box helicase family protein [Candidatus Microthrix parvicella]CCM65194.1 putative restriction endonuclease domain protein [Candidatus Microthrix parvicella RN1]